MDSKRRMVELHIWDQSFFTEFSQTEKLFYWFVICKCDNVGVYKHNPSLAAFHCGGEVDLNSFVDKVNGDETSIELFKSDSIWIRDFVRETWGTIAAGNNLGLSCYKLLHKHGLLGRFIHEFPNCINIKSFRDYITEEKKGYADLPLPQACPKLDPENSVYEEYEGQGSPRAGTINFTNSINGVISNSSLSSYKKAEKIYKAYPKEAENEVALLGNIESLLEELSLADISDPESYLMDEIGKLSKADAPPPEDFFNDLKQGQEVPF